MPTSAHNLETSSHARERLRVDGFVHEFELTDTAVIDLASGTSYTPESMEIVSTHRNEGDTDPGDESVTFALRAPDGTMGALTTNYGTDAPHADAMRLLGTAA